APDERKAETLRLHEMLNLRCRNPDPLESGGHQRLAKGQFSSRCPLSPAAAEVRRKTDRLNRGATKRHVPAPGPFVWRKHPLHGAEVMSLPDVGSEDVLVRAKPRRRLLIIQRRDPAAEIACVRPSSRGGRIRLDPIFVHENVIVREDQQIPLSFTK